MTKDEKDDLHKGISVAVWDIETTGLNADYGYILCVCFKDAITGETKTVRIDDPRNPDKSSDKWVVKEAIKIMNSYDLLVSWYGIRFDHPFVNTRAMKHRLKLPDKNFRRDLWFSCRSNLKLRSNRLAVVGDFLFGKTRKNAITPKFWNGAIRGEKAALDYVTLHCRLDLEETLRVYKRFIPMLSKRLRKN